ncbi:hypothetical protein LTR36_004619 [Oleoguttula mirabilis]|uniref:Actin-like ATPase domain-containing protein n=1 Tax=Oleoguttula mirabilis TaxID=1507867 RepID=A0AAV9JGE0_9PEZI|nr:hypothetical protein LTR36_004619 [Oleoguttula mirabilis]
MDRKAPSDTLVIGIDFGTTFSGAAAAYSANPEAPDEIAVIKTWPGGNNITSDKVPSEVTYGQGSSAATPDTHRLRLDGHDDRRLRFTQFPLNGGQSSFPGDTFAFDAFNTKLDVAQLADTTDPADAGHTRWGFQIRPDEQRLRCLKLFLDPHQPIPSYVSIEDMKNQLTASGKNVGTAVTEYLRLLFTHTKEILARRYGEQFIATTKHQVVLTVPAVWSDTAKDATLKAAEAAGMGDDIKLISEPEAAAVYTLQVIQPSHLTIGHNFVVVDAGGGTVDLITYGIKQLTPLRLEEMVPGSGGCCGAALLNERFRQFVRSKLGDANFSDICQTKPRSWLMALKYFEDYVKRNFNPSEQAVFNIPFPGVSDSRESGIEQGFMRMTSADVGSLFRPIIEDIVGLIEGQLGELHAMGHKAKGLILVGGFGQSECLLKCLRNRFSGGEQGLEVMQPVNAWTAVVRGAVLRRLEGTELVLHRKARRHYGVKCNTAFVAGIHDVGRKVWDDLEKCWHATNEMRWYIAKGDTVCSTQPILFPFYRCFALGASRTVTDELIICDDNFAPSVYSSAPGSATRVVCKMVVNLQSVPKHLWKELTNSSGERYDRLDYKVGMQIESGGLRFDCRVDGVVYGKATATFR